MNKERPAFGDLATHLREHFNDFSEKTGVTISTPPPPKPESLETRLERVIKSCEKTLTRANLNPQTRVEVSTIVRALKDLLK